jgi:hypothetical protein
MKPSKIGRNKERKQREINKRKQQMKEKEKWKVIEEN